MAVFMVVCCGMNPNRLKNRVEFVRDGLLGRLDTDRLENG
jgi:hypothetical protein